MSKDAKCVAPGLEPDERGRGIVARYSRDFEDFAVGEVYEHRPRRTATAADDTQFSLLTMNRRPLHCREAYGKQTEFGQTLMNSTLTAAIVTGLRWTMLAPGLSPISDGAR